MRNFGIIASGIALLLCAGCRTTRQEATQKQQWEDTISRRIVDLEARLFDLENSLAGVKRDQNTLDLRLARIENSSTIGSAQQRAEIEALRKELDSTRGTTEKKISIILDEVARENERILKSIQSSRGKAGFAQGYEHVVKSGESISTIAREYKVTSDAIVQANQLTNPNSIRVGQILFIPQ
ncbi:MAG: LysM peptidoglycan-binding domain-containing protein [PVC group bacterium]